MSAYTKAYNGAMCDRNSFKDLCEICATNEKFSDDLLNHKTIDIGVYAEFLKLVVPILSNHKLFEEFNGDMPLSSLMNVAEEAFCLLVFENCFKHWTWVAMEKLTGKVSASSSSVNTHSSSSSSLTLSPVQQREDNHECIPSIHSKESDPSNTSVRVCLQNKSLLLAKTSQANDSENEEDDNDAEDNDDGEISSISLGPGYKYQNMQVRKDNKIGAGPWKSQGMKRYNEIVDKVIKARDVRTKFEELLMSFFLDKQTVNNKTKKRKRADDDEDSEATVKVVVIDLFSEDDD